MFTATKINKKNILAIIPARAGSKRIPNKNIRKFLGKPLISYAIKQALSLKIDGYVIRVVVDTDSPKIAALAQRYGAEIPFLRPPHLARDNSRVIDSIIHMLKNLKEKGGYVPLYIMILQTTSPLREIIDIKNCWQLMQSRNATTVLTICRTDPKFYNLGKNGNIILVNGSEAQSTNVQAWKAGYVLNGCFVYIIKTDALLEEKRIITKNTKAIVCPKWRSVDLDEPEDWIHAETLFKNKKYIYGKIKRFEK